MKKIVLIIILAVVHLIATAQNQTKNLSLNEAMTIALSGRADIQAMNYNTLVAQNNIDKFKKEWMPEVSAKGGIHYNMLLQGTLIPAGFGGLPEAKILALGAKHITSFGIDISEPLYKPSLKTDMSLADLNLQATKENKSLAEIAVKTKVAEAYYNINLRKLQLGMLQKVKARYGEYLKIVEGKFKNGTALESEYLKTKLDFDNADIDITKGEQAYAFALTYLKYLMNMPKETDIVLTDTLQLDGNLANPETLTTAQINRPELRLLALQNQSYNLMTKKTKENLLPTVTAYGNLSLQFLNNGFNYAKWDYWNPYTYIGVRANVPISARFKTDEIIKEYALKQQQGELDKKQRNADISFEIEKAKTDMANALLNMKSSRMSYDLATELYAQQIKQFALGGLLYTNILDTERSINASEQSYTRSVYDYFIAKISLNKATGTFE
jgi:outer membrane protein TolC